MDRSLDDAIAERQGRNNGNRGRRTPRRNDWPRDGVRKSTRDDRGDPDHWVHDRFDDDPDTRRNIRGSQNRRQGRLSPEAEEPPSTKIRVDNLHYDLTEEDLEDLFARIGPVISVSLRYDRAGRSDGTAYVVYSRLTDARAAIAEFNGANAKGQPISLSLMPTGPSASRNVPTGPSFASRDRNPFDTARMPAKSLFERISAPAGRSASPESEGSKTDDVDGRPKRRGALPVRRSDVSKPPPENIDRYVPGQTSRSRSPPRRERTGRRGDGGRRGGERRERNDSRRNGRETQSGRDGEGRRLVGGRPRKTQEELDREMEDYWGGNTANGGDIAPEQGGAGFGAVTQPLDVNVPAVQVDEDVDMIE